MFVRRLHALLGACTPVTGVQRIAVLALAAAALAGCQTAALESPASKRVQAGLCAGATIYPVARPDGSAAEIVGAAVVRGATCYEAPPPGGAR